MCSPDAEVCHAWKAIGKVRNNSCKYVSHQRWHVCPNRSQPPQPVCCRCEGAWHSGPPPQAGGDTSFEPHRTSASTRSGARSLRVCATACDRSVCGNRRGPRGSGPPPSPRAGPSPGGRGPPPRREQPRGLWCHGVLRHLSAAKEQVAQQQAQTTSMVGIAPSTVVILF